MSGFHDMSFPAKLARGAIGGPFRQTNVQTRANGIETRNIALLHSRRRWEIASKGSSLDEIHETLVFFEARMGKVYGFRFKDPMDNKSCLPSLTPAFTDQIIGTGNGTNKVFQLQKKYGDAQNSYYRPIKLPVLNSVSIGVSGAIKESNTYSINYQTGEINFTTAPANGAQITAGFSFDNMVRFDNDALEIMMDSATTARINTINLVEILS